MARAAAYACYRCGQEFPLDLVIDSRGCRTCFSEAPSNLHMVYRQADGGPPVGQDRSLPSLWRFSNRRGEVKLLLAFLSGTSRIVVLP